MHCINSYNIEFPATVARFTIGYNGERRIPYFDAAASFLPFLVCFASADVNADADADADANADAELPPNRVVEIFLVMKSIHITYHRWFEGAATATTP